MTPTGRAVAFMGPRQVGLVEFEEPAPGPLEVRLRTLYSGISAGTELTAYRGSNPCLEKRWDEQRRLFVEARHDEAAGAFRLLDQRPEQAVQVVLDFT